MTNSYDALPEPNSLFRLAAQLVSETLACEVQGVFPILGAGIINTVFRVETTTAPLILRLNRMEHLASYRKEQWCLSQARQHGIPVPTVRAVGVYADHAFMVQDYIPGISGAGVRVDVGKVWFRLGELAAQANSIAPSGYGGEMDSAHPGVFTATWQGMLANLVTTVFRNDYWTEQGGLTIPQRRQLDRWSEQLATLESPAGLCHTDIGPLNVILRNGAIDDLYLIDWEMAEAAPVPAYQLASVARYWGCKSVVMQEFVRGYQTRVVSIDLNDPAFKGLTALGALAIVRWAQDHQPETVEEYTRSAQAIVAELTASKRL